MASTKACTNGCCRGRFIQYKNKYKYHIIKFVLAMLAAVRGALVTSQVPSATLSGTTLSVVHCV